MSHDIFISYSSKDKPIADGICANLEAAGLRCWIAPRDIAPGEEWPKAITNAIAASQVMVLVFSSNSNASSDVGREIVLAANKNLIIIPFKIENVEPEPGKQYYLAQTHWLEAMNPPTKAQIKSLVDRVRMIIPPLDVEPSMLPPVPTPLLVIKQPSTPGPKPKTGWFRREYLWVGLFLLLILFVVIFGSKLLELPASPTATPTITVPLPTLAGTGSFQPTSVELPTSTATKIVITPTPEAHYSLLKTLAGHTDDISSVAFSPDGNTLASSSKDYTVILWDTSNWTELKTLAVFTNQVNCVAFSPDGKTMASGSGQGIMLWDTTTWTAKQTLTDHTGAVNSLTFSPDGRKLASGSSDKTIILWDTTSYSKLLTLYDHTWMVWGLAFSPDGRYLASGGYKESTIMVHDTTRGTLMQTLVGSSGDVHSLDFSPDGLTLASGSEKKLVTLWDATSWNKEQTFAPGNYIAFSPDGRTLAGGDYNFDITLWDTSNWSSRQTLKGHTGEITSLAFSPDGSTLASGSNDGTVKIWKLDIP